MHFVVEIAVCGRYPHRPVQQLVSVIITRAIAAFSVRNVDPQRSVIMLSAVHIFSFYLVACLSWPNCSDCCLLPLIIQFSTRG